MLLTVLSGLFGFLSTLLPDVMRYIQDRQDKKHELELARLQIERDRLAISEAKEAIESTMDAEVLQSLYNTQKPSSIPWVQAANDLIRPILAYIIILDYVIVTYLSYSTLKESGVLNTLDLNLIIEAIKEILWSESDRDAFMMVMGFAFGSVRYLRKQ